VTGASLGLCRAVALGFAATGADVVLASRREDACQLAVDEIAALYLASAASNYTAAPCSTSLEGCRNAQ
jgi:NAD(P)-dependent dehydrogenase (short-subunit alcohol dehydrogenase family)